MVGLSRKSLRDVDITVLLAPIALTLFGCIGIYSTAPNLWKKQILFLVIGIIVALVLTFMDYRKVLVNVSPVFYVLTIFLLVLVLTPLGKTINGNKSWLSLGGFGFQPSEFAKLATILMLTRYIAQSGAQKTGRDGFLSIKDLAIMVGIVLPPLILVRMENDTGTMLTFGAILATFFFMAGMRKWMLVAGILALPLVLVAVYPHLKTYQKQRIMAILEPSQVDPRGFGWQTIQSVIAVGSGGPTGKGITNGTQGRLGFLPNAWSDFIAATLAEETGLVGVVFIMALYMALLWRLFSIALGARDRGGALLVMGLIGLMGFHIACNLGMVVGLMPIMGIPLPLVSQGGTSVIAIFAGLGLALSVRLQRFVN
jgi:rod shape determining protein RodA